MVAFRDGDRPVRPLPVISLDSKTHPESFPFAEMPFCGMLRITRFLIVTLVCPAVPRNAPASRSVVLQPVPSRTAPYSPTRTSPLFGDTALVSEYVPALRQNVVFSG